MTIAEFAQTRNISYESARQRVNRYKDQLKGHIVRTTHGFEIDDFAVQYLDERRERSMQNRQVQIVSTNELKRLQLENETLKQEIQDLKEKLQKVGAEIPTTHKRKWYEVLFGTKGG